MSSATPPPPTPGASSTSDAPPPPAPGASSTTAPPPTPGTGPTSLPPPAVPSSAAAPPARTGEATGRQWSQRLPELLGGAGALLVLASLVGLLSSTWSQLDLLGQGLALAALAAAMTAGAVFSEQRGEPGGLLSSLVWVSASLVGGGALVLASSALLGPGYSRLVALAAGAAVAAHAGVGVARLRDSALRQLAVVAGLLIAAGPFGTDLADRARWSTILEALAPVQGAFDPTWTSGDYLVTGPAHLLIAVGWLVAAPRLARRPARLARVGGTLLAGYAALQLLVLPSGLGALAALLVVGGLLVAGLVGDRVGLVVLGVGGLLVAGVRLLGGLFSGEVAVVVATMAVGLALLGWAVRERSHRSEVDGTEGPTEESA